MHAAQRTSAETPLEIRLVRIRVGVSRTARTAITLSVILFGATDLGAVTGIGVAAADGHQIGDPDATWGDPDAAGARDTSILPAIDAVDSSTDVAAVNSPASSYPAAPSYPAKSTYPESPSYPGSGWGAD